MVRDKKVSALKANGEECDRLEFHLFAVLTKGSYFNIVNSFLDRPSLFSFVIAENNTQMLELEQEDFT